MISNFLSDCHVSIGFYLASVVSHMFPLFFSGFFYCVLLFSMINFCRRRLGASNPEAWDNWQEFERTVKEELAKETMSRVNAIADKVNEAWFAVIHLLEPN